ncbi:MAG: cation-transporting P-type ATPase, partial [Rhodomicrobium sp.]
MMQDQLAVKPQADAATIDAPGDANGLTEAEAARRLAQYGENALVEHRESVFERLARFFWGPIPWMIEAAAVLIARFWPDAAQVRASRPDIRCAGLIRPISGELE